MVNFLKYKWLYFLISATVIGGGIFSIVRWGYIYSIDFVGGTNLEYQFDRKFSRKEVESFFKTEKIEIIEFNIQNNVLLVRAKTIDEKIEQKLKINLEKKLGKLVVLKSETVGATLGQETVFKTVIASFLGMIAILLYMSFAFKGINAAIAAILAAFHDLLVIFGS